MMVERVCLCGFPEGEPHVSSAHEAPSFGVLADCGECESDRHALCEAFQIVEDGWLCCCWSVVSARPVKTGPEARP